MDTLWAARAQMALSLGFHMVFAACSIGMPLLMLIAEGLWLRTGQAHYRDLARKWGKATALLFAIGAVSGTALSFELGLLWPRFMAFAGGVVGPGFVLEGFAFFIEAIFLALYLYGWDRLSPLAHWLTGIPVAVFGLGSGILVVAVNAWMQNPGPLELDSHGNPVNGNPLAPFASPSWPAMAVHSSLSCYIAVGFAVAGVYAIGALRGRRDAYHRSALKLALAVGTVAALLEPLSGDVNARLVHQYQPAKLAAMEALFETRAGAPLLIGGLPEPRTGRVPFAIEIPRGLSLLAAHDPAAVIEGLNAFPPDERPNVMLVHPAFQVMVGCGLLLVALGLWFWWGQWRGWAPDSRRLLWALVLGAPLGFLALEAGWLVTELGRQPWTVYRILRTADAVTPATEVTVSLTVFTLLYLGLATVLVVLLRRLARAGAAPAGKETAHVS
jgi:cytochrome d ubiquinol oxidase subunit I